MPGIRALPAPVTILAVLALALGLWACGAPGARLFSAGEGMARAELLYSRHCAACHGEEGRADTAVADLLFPRPRPFHRGLFKLASTENGVPSDADLMRTLRRGMPGSVMASFGWMAEGDLHLLAAHVRLLAAEGIAALQMDQAAAAGERPAPERARTYAELRTTPGPVVETGEALPPDPEVLQRGRDLYLVHCAACHGEDGEGRELRADWAGSDDTFWARDFTAGILRGGASHEDIAWRIAAGMPGARMPPTRLEPDDLGALVAYVRSLIPGGVADRLVQTRRDIEVARVDRLPTRTDDPAWATVEPTRLPLAALWWRPDAVPWVDLAALHDGERMAVRITWPDATRNDRALTGSPRPDGAALQLSSSEDPPLLAMGTAEEAVRVWHWMAFRPRDVAGALDLLEHPRGARPDVPVYAPEPGIGRPARRGAADVAHGFDSVRAWTDEDTSVQADPLWRGGHWALVLSRPLAELREPIHVACAVWEGEGGDHGGSKSVTPWHRLVLR